MIIVAFLYFQNEKTLYFDLIKSNMQNTTSKISNQIIFSHMRGLNFNKEEYLNSKEYKIAFYDENKKKIFGNIDEKIDFSKKLILNEDFIILIDNSTVGHLGIEYIVLKDGSLSNKVEDLKLTIVLLFILFYSLISIIGIYLAKLFLKPIKDEREKLNNFIKDTTHELNTPISAIMMSSENENLSSKQIERIRLSANRISEIYKDLTYTFLENSSNKKKSELLNLKILIEEQMAYFDVLCTKKRIKLEKNLEDFEYKIVKDDFIRLFNNLFSNAIKYNKVGGNINISLKDGTFIIGDSGIGIAKNKIKDIYTRYFRATKEQGGFGLGLNIVNQICKSYDIKIDVNSQENQGTTFILTFK